MHLDPLSSPADQVTRPKVLRSHFDIDLPASTQYVSMRRDERNTMDMETSFLLSSYQSYSRKNYLVIRSVTELEVNS